MTCSLCSAPLARNHGRRVGTNREASRVFCPAHAAVDSGWVDGDLAAAFAALPKPKAKTPAPAATPAE